MMRRKSADTIRVQRIIETEYMTASQPILLKTEIYLLQYWQGPYMTLRPDIDFFNIPSG